MWNLQVGLVDGQMVIKQDVNINGTVVIDAVFRFLSAAQLPFNELRAPQHFTGQQFRLAAHHGIQEVVFRPEAPRLGLNKS